MAAQRRSAGRVYLCFDEWNVWYKTFNREGLEPDAAFPRPLIEEVYNLEDALVVAGFLNSFIRHADSVKIANLAQMVNVIAPILTRGDELLKQSIFYAFEMYSKRRGGTSLRPAVDGPAFSPEVRARTALHPQHGRGPVARYGHVQHPAVRDAGDRPAGRVTSVCDSPGVGAIIGLGYVAGASSEPGTTR